MAELKCPSCQQEGFSWSIDEEESPLTRWGCRNCRYSAMEDESYERPCEECRTSTRLRLEDSERSYWWCSTCNKTWNIE